MLSTTTALISLWALASPADWTATFPPDAAGSYLEVDASSVLVAAGGEPSADLSAAVRALADALRASGRAKLVMDASVIGSTAGLSDEQIVQKCQAMPVQ